MSLLAKCLKKKNGDAAEELAAFLREMKNRKFCGRQVIMVSFGFGNLSSVDFFTENLGK